MSTSRWKVLIVCAGWIAIAGLLGCRGDAVARPNIIMIVVDTLRADSVRPTDRTSPMPFVSELASESVFFERAHAPSSWTLPSMTSVFLAKYPSQHTAGARGWKDTQPAGATLAGTLSKHGYHTAARITHPFLTRAVVGRGFADFRLVPVGPSKEDGLASLTVAALQWIDASLSSDAPFFLYLHYLEPHNPYLVHPGITAKRQPFSGRSDGLIGLKPGSGTLMDSEEERRAAWNFTDAEVVRMRELYDGEVRYVDSNLKVLFDNLEENGLLEKSIVVITSDHGEEFGEHGVFGHGASLFGAVTRVPLIVVLPDGSQSRIIAPVEIGGIAPALLNELKIALPDDFTIPAIHLRGEPGTLRPVYLDLPIAPQLKLHLHRRGSVHAKAKLLISDDGKEHFFRVNTNGVESTANADVPDANSLRNVLAKVSDFSAGQQPKVQTLDEQQLNELRALGYMPD